MKVTQSMKHILILFILQDGTKVPVSIVWRPSAHASSSSASASSSDSGSASKAPLPSPAPLLLYGYGSYGHSIDMYFNSASLSLCDRGVVYAVAHVRGGGEMGRFWYEDEGKLLTKKNTFSDFIACAEHLVATGWADPKRIGAMGASAGVLSQYGYAAAIAASLFSREFTAYYLLVAFLSFCYDVQLAGGLLMGCIANARPDLWAAIVSQVSGQQR